MHFSFDTDQQEIRRTARELLGRHATLAHVRAAAERGEDDADLWARVAQLGWPGIAVGEQHGGGGLGVVDLAVLLEESGYALAPVPLLGSVCAALVIESAGSPEQQAAWLPRLATGAARGALGTVRDGEAANVPDGAGADVVVLVDGDDGAWLLESPGAVTRVETIDPTRRYADVRRNGARLPGDVGAGLGRALVAVAAELVGISQRALDLTVDYVGQRRQFDRPIGAFQAVAHRCADMLLATESARSATYFAAWAADADPGRLAEAACLAKIAASDAGREVTASAIQAFGGIGFTWEADVHWFHKRAQLDAQHLGGARHHRARLAALLDARPAAATA